MKFLEGNDGGVGDDESREVRVAGDVKNSGSIVTVE